MTALCFRNSHALEISFVRVWPKTMELIIEETETDISSHYILAQRQSTQTLPSQPPPQKNPIKKTKKTNPQCLTFHIKQTHGLFFLGTINKRLALPPLEDACTVSLHKVTLT